MQAREVVFTLRRRPIADMVAFQRRFDERAAQLLSAELWAFYYLVDGGCSDDVFLFEVPSRVIALGRDVYEAAVANPDSLIRHVGRNCRRYVNYSATECHKLGDAAEVAYRMLTGHDDFARLVGVKPEASRSLSWNPHDEGWLAHKLPCTWQSVAPKRPAQDQTVQE